MPEPGQIQAAPTPAPDAAGAATGAGAGGPAPSPMTTPNPMMGLEKAGRVKAQVISKAVGAIVNDFPFGSKEQKALISVLKTLADTFGKTADDDQGQMKSETLSMLGLLKPAGGAKPPMPAAAPAGAPAPAAPAM
jgi:hypothetical protein